MKQESTVRLEAFTRGGLRERCLCVPLCFPAVVRPDCITTGRGRRASRREHDCFESGKGCHPIVKPRCSSAGLFTRHEPNPRVGVRTFFKISRIGLGRFWVGSGRVGRCRVGSGGLKILTNRVRSPLPHPTLSYPTRPDSTRPDHARFHPPRG